MEFEGARFNNLNTVKQSSPPHVAPKLCIFNSFACIPNASIILVCSGHVYVGSADKLSFRVGRLYVFKRWKATAPNNAG